MTNKTPGKVTLNDAYALETTQDSIDLYAKWAKTYDESFAKEYDYNAPDIIAKTYADRCHDKSAPVLDIGAGTGLVAEGLVKRGVATVDAFDISAEMLQVADQKGLYRDLIQGDLTKTLDIPDASYDGITSTGTFTHGHVGPEALDEMIRIGRPGALYVLSIRSTIFESAGFKEKFEALSGQIRDFEIIEKSLYGKSAKAELRNSNSSVTIFHKA
jgi:ubiquinone/menaquinone biosynthesis C-methylase UbiE